MNFVRDQIVADSRRMTSIMRETVVHKERLEEVRAAFVLRGRTAQSGLWRRRRAE